MGASLDPYELHTTRPTLDFVEGLASHMLDMFPFLSEAKVNRQWAGLADMTPDFAPLMGVTPIEGFYLDAGWGTWGFKAPPRWVTDEDLDLPAERPAPGVGVRLWRRDAPCARSRPVQRCAVERLRVQ